VSRSNPLLGSNPSASNAVLEIQGLSTVLETDAGLVRAIDTLSISIKQGETFALVGESGCGKSMTALSLLRLLPDNGRIEAGAMRLNSQDLCALSEQRMREVRGRKISIIFQEPSTSLNPVMKVGQQIVEVIERHSPLRGGAARAKAIDWLERVGIPEPARRVDTYPFEMSGGQKQRVMIALALAAEPDLLIADEPTTALDVTIQKQILELLMRLQKEQGMAMFLITHDLGIVSDMAHHIALMYAGQIVEVASAREFFSAPSHPYARLLLKALPDVSKRSDRLAAIPGTVPALSTVFQGCRFAERCGLKQDRCVERPIELLKVNDEHEVRCVLALETARQPNDLPVFSKDRQRLTEPVGPDQAASFAPTIKPVHPVEPATSLALDIRHLSVRFPIRGGLFRRARHFVTAVDDVSLVIPSGRTLALVGESGCGKTTMGKAVLQLLRGRAEITGQALLGSAFDSEKEITADLFSLSGSALREARRDLQIIFQDPFSSLNPRMLVNDILDEGMACLQGQWSKDDRQREIFQLLDKVGLRREALTRYPHEFSGGQRQRIAIARALAVRPKVIVCDEPTSALDVSVQAQILNLLKDLQADTGVSYLFITHNIGVVEYLADEVAVMKAGKIVEQGQARNVLSSPSHAYTRTLLEAVPRVR
jgi:peptide/nickel transport system ATP-binding protein